MSGRIAAVVLARDRPAMTRETIDALLVQEPAADTLVLIDNAATPEVRATLEEAAARHPDGHVVSSAENLGCAGGYELGLRHVLDNVDAEFLCGFDDDATPLPGCLGALRDAAQRLPAVGAVGAVAHAADGRLAWPMYVDGEDGPVSTVDEVRALAGRRSSLPVHNLAWQGMMFPTEVLRRHGLPWGALFLQYEDIELGLRLRRAGLHSYLVPEAECRHPAPPPARAVRLLGRQIDVTRQSAAKEYLTLRNGLVVRRRYDGLRFWYGTGPFVILRGVLSAFAMDVPLRKALRHVVVQGIADAVRGRLGPPPPGTARL
ncbi:MAG: glycosyltransferase family 2 protein [Solirubrobacteraceae bacterium]